MAWSAPRRVACGHRQRSLILSSQRGKPWLPKAPPECAREPHGDLERREPCGSRSARDLAPDAPLGQHLSCDELGQRRPAGGTSDADVSKPFAFRTVLGGQHVDDRRATRSMKFSSDNHGSQARGLRPTR